MINCYTFLVIFWKTILLLYCQKYRLHFLIRWSTLDHISYVNCFGWPRVNRKTVKAKKITDNKMLIML